MRFQELIYYCSWLTISLLGGIVSPEHQANSFSLRCLGKVKSAYEPSGPSGRRLTPVSVARSDWEYCYSPMGGMLVHHKVTPQHYDRRYPFIHLGEESQCGIKFLVYGNNTTAETRLEPPTCRSEVKRANH